MDEYAPDDQVPDSDSSSDDDDDHQGHDDLEKGGGAGPGAAGDGVATPETVVDLRGPGPHTPSTGR